MKTGPDIERDGLVFGYDTGFSSDSINLSKGRFFKGPAHTNLVEEIDPSYGVTNNTNFFNNGGVTEEVYIPHVGKRNVQYVEYFNNRYAADGSVNSGTTCCPNLFHYFVSGAPYIDVDSSANYTYSIIYKHTGGYHHPNFMYHYQKNSSNTTLTEGGVSSTNSDRRKHLGNGWYHAWGNIATQSTCTNVLLYSFLYNYGTVKHKFYVAAVSFVKNTTGGTYLKIPPHLMKEPAVTVSSTQSLIDLKKSKDIDVDDASFDSNGRLSFDGTDDRLDNITGVGISNYSSPFSMECVFKVPTSGTWANDRQSNVFSIAGSYAGQYGIYKKSTDTIGFQIRDASTNGYCESTGHSKGVYHHVIITFGGGSGMKLYINGELKSSNTTSFTGTPDSTNLYIGGQRAFGGSSGSWFEGEIPITKYYSKALTASEIKQNFNAYRKRFKI
jgi:hypothetical protein